MHDRLADYADSLEPEQRDLLLSSIPFLISLCVGADRDFDELELRAAVDVLVDSTDTLGHAFRFSPAAQGAFDVISARARQGWTSEGRQRLSALGAVVLAMPLDVQQPYRAFVGKMCLDLMKSSRTYLWFGAQVSKEEKDALVRVVEALGIPVEGELREVIGERVRDLKRA